MLEGEEWRPLKILTKDFPTMEKEMLGEPAHCFFPGKWLSV